MKRSIIIALALALALGTAAIAEVADTAEDVEITVQLEYHSVRGEGGRQRDEEGCEAGLCAERWIGV